MQKMRNYNFSFIIFDFFWLHYQLIFLALFHGCDSAERERWTIETDVRMDAGKSTSARLWTKTPTSRSPPAQAETLPQLLIFPLYCYLTGGLVIYLTHAGEVLDPLILQIPINSLCLWFFFFKSLQTWSYMVGLRNCRLVLYWSPGGKVQRCSSHNRQLRTNLRNGRTKRAKSGQNSLDRNQKSEFPKENVRVFDWQ